MAYQLTNEEIGKRLVERGLRRNRNMLRYYRQYNRKRLALERERERGLKSHPR